jgi:hypothetical protein
MAHFAQLDKDNKVVNVIVISNDETHDEDGVENEALGIAFCQSLFGKDTKWVQTSYNGNLRKNFASIGGLYDSDLDAFIEVKYFNSWVLNKDTLHYEPPIAMPNDGKEYKWDEANVSWVEEAPLAIE